MSDLIPQSSRASVEGALLAAFGVAAPDAPPARLAGGLSGSLLLRIRVGGVPYVLRIEGPPGPFADLGRAYGCMRAAAEALLAPRVWHADAQAGVAILDFIPHRALTFDYPGDGRGLVVELAQGLKVLHALPAFPPAIDYLDGLGLILRRLGEFAGPAAEDLLAGFESLRARYRTRPADLVSSHNDLNPANVLYDGRRLWFIDWDAAFLADRYADLASLANWFTTDAMGEALLLAAYFGRPADSEEAARLRVMRVANHLFYGAMFLLGSAAVTPGPLHQPPPLDELRRRLALGELSFDQAENRALYGRARLAAALAAMRSPGYLAALDAL